MTGTRREREINREAPRERISRDVCVCVAFFERHAPRERHKQRSAERDRSREAPRERHKQRSEGIIVD